LLSEYIFSVVAVLYYVAAPEDGWSILLRTNRADVEALKG
jgi:hypothetical protein